MDSHIRCSWNSSNHSKFNLDFDFIFMHLKEIHGAQCEIHYYNWILLLFIDQVL